MPSPTSRAIIESLSKHDLSETVSRSVRQMGANVRQRTIYDLKECGAFIDAETGDQVGNIVVGTANRLQVDSLLNKMLPGRRYVCVHSHPEDDGFSPDDVALVLRFRAVCVISAVGRRGTWYVLSLDPDRAPPSLQETLDAFKVTRDVVVPKYRERVQSGGMTRRDAQSAATHEVWEHIAPALGLRYDRVI